MSRARALAILTMLTLGAGLVEARPRALLLRGGTVHTVSGPAIEGGSVLVGWDGRIAAVGADVEAPAGTEVMDVTGKVVTPGLIDGMTRLGLVGIMAVSGSKDDAARATEADPINAAFLAADGFDPANIAIPVARMQGVTSVVSAPTGGLVAGRSAWVQLWDDRAYGQVVRSPVAMHVTLGEGASPLTGGSRGTTMLALRELYDDVRFYETKKKLFDENRSRRLAASRLDLEALAATLGGGLPVVFHVHRASDILAALAFSQREGLRPIIVGGAEAWMVASELASAKAPVIVQPVMNIPSSFEMLGARSDNAALLTAAGVSVVISTLHAFDYKHDVGTLSQLAGNAVRAGMPHDAALRAVTLAPAEVFGMASEVGSLQAGRSADVVVWSGDPFELSSVPELVLIGGSEVPLVSRQTKLFDRYRTIPRRAPASAD